MHKALAETIAENYAIAVILPMQPVSGGFLSSNFIFGNGENKYFLKQYRLNEAPAIAAIHAAKFFFARANVPVILPVADKQGNTYFTHDQKFYSLFPFVEGRHLTRGQLSAPAIESAAAMLSRIHQAGKNVFLPNVQVRSAVRSYAQFAATAQLILEKLAQPQLSEFDRLAEACIRLKCSLAERHRPQFSEINLPSDHLVHGDYQDGNLFFSAADQVSHVFDWELTRVIGRGLELARALEFICFGNPDNFNAVFSDENYATARRFLQTYQAHYPIPWQEFQNAWHARYFDKLLSLWVESEHYLLDNPRVDCFLESEYTTIQHYSSHLDHHINRLCEGILR